MSGVEQSTVAGRVFAPLDMDAALEALTGILSRREITSPPVRRTPRKPRADVPAPEHPLTQKIVVGQAV